MHRGFFLLWRKIEDSGLEQDGDTLAMFMYFTRKARVTDATVITRRQPVDLERGQLVTGIDSLVFDLKQSRGKIRRGLKLLENMGIIGRQTTPIGSIITVTNYDRYQPRPKETYTQFCTRIGIPTTPSRHPDDTLATPSRPLSKSERLDLDKPGSMNEEGASAEPAAGAPPPGNGKDHEPDLEIFNRWVASFADTPAAWIAAPLIAKAVAGVDAYYQGRGGAFTPRRRAIFAKRMQRYDAESVLAACEIYFDLHAASKDERYLAGIAMRLAKGTEKERDLEIDRHRERFTAVGVIAEIQGRAT